MNLSLRTVVTIPFFLSIIAMFSMDWWCWALVSFQKYSAFDRTKLNPSNAVFVLVILWWFNSLKNWEQADCLTVSLYIEIFTSFVTRPRVSRVTNNEKSVTDCQPFWDRSFSSFISTDICQALCAESQKVTKRDIA